MTAGLRILRHKNGCSFYVRKKIYSFWRTLRSFENLEELGLGQRRGRAVGILDCVSECRCFEICHCAVASGVIQLCAHSTTNKIARAFLAPTAPTSMLAEAAASTLLALFAQPMMLADACPSTLLALIAPPMMLADACSSTLLA